MHEAWGKWPPPRTISLRDLINDVGGSFYVTQHYDNGRVGWTPFENKLRISAVRDSFKPLFAQHLDDVVQAQPLYVRNVAIPGKAAEGKVRLYKIFTVKEVLDRD